MKSADISRFLRRLPDPEESSTPESGVEDIILNEAVFKKFLRHERRRTERSGHPFALMLVDLTDLIRNRGSNRLAAAVASATRETDITGWYESDRVVGVIFTTLTEADRDVIRSVIQRKVSQALSKIVAAVELAKVRFTVHFFPEPSDNAGSGPMGPNLKAKVQVNGEIGSDGRRPESGRSGSDEKLYPDLVKEKGSRFSVFLKRCIDVIASLILIILLSPVLAVIALLVKLSSKGPVLFRQTRLGQFGKHFTFLKFRSMHVNNAPDIHQKFVFDFIAGKNGNGRAGSEKAHTYKIKNDPRVTRIGRFLRKSSLDELPQLFNVLKGDMSLVGPRPPVPYEYAKYGVWHRRRVLEARPGITGLWQVNGRSRTTFDEMVRLDLQYVREWSLWLDVKILCKTPVVILSADGAY
jgi:lipopolysaccharide/colanic/teichoic acid biosynthesis glycosyltransferase